MCHSRERAGSSTLPPASLQSWGRHPCAAASLKAAGDSSRCQHLAANIPALPGGKEVPKKLLLLLLCSSKQKRSGSTGCGSVLADVRLSPHSP